MKAIGFSGFAFAGKTTAANYVQSRYGFQRVHIATTLRSMLAVMLNHLGYDDIEIYDILEGDRKDGWIIPELGVTSRHLQITIGTEWGRELVNPDIWVKTWGNLAKSYGRAMNDSVRFPNEEDVICSDLGGFTILIERPGTGPAKFLTAAAEEAYRDAGEIQWDFVHPSERIDLLDPTYIIVNDSTERDLFEQLDGILALEGIFPVTEMKLGGKAGALSAFAS